MFPKPGDKVVIISGEFRGTIMAVDRVYEQSSGLIVLQTLNQETLHWSDFCSVTLSEFTQMTRPL